MPRFICRADYRSVYASIQRPDGSTLVLNPGETVDLDVDPRPEYEDGTRGDIPTLQLVPDDLAAEDKPSTGETPVEAPAEPAEAPQATPTAPGEDSAPAPASEPVAEQVADLQAEVARLEAETQPPAPLAPPAPPA